MAEVRGEARQDALLTLPNGRHVLAFDGLRGLAVILVLFFHLGAVSFGGHGWLMRWLGNLQLSGWIGVEIFFTLSGFLITRILLQTSRDQHYFRNFYLRRTLRIFPLYYGTLAILGVLALALRLDWNGCLPALLLYVQNFRTGDEGLRLALTGKHGPILLAHFWSLAVEEQFYLFWPLLVWLLRGRRLFLAGPILIVIVCPLLRVVALREGVAFAPLRYWTFFHLDTLAWGALGAGVSSFCTAPFERVFRISVLLTGSLGCAAVLIAEHGRVLERSPVTVTVFFTVFWRVLLRFNDAACKGRCAGLALVRGGRASMVRTLQLWHVHLPLPVAKSFALVQIRGQSRDWVSATQFARDAGVRILAHRGDGIRELLGI